MDSAKVNVAARLYILETSTGHRISLDDISIDLTKEQYERLLVSYKENKPKYMNDDEKIADICNSFIDYYGYEDLEENQTLVVSYPIEICNGLSFESLHKNTNGNSGSEYTGKHSGKMNSNWLPVNEPTLNSSKNSLELSDGYVAFHDHKRDTYVCNVDWLGRLIKVEIYSTELELENQIDTVKEAFESFMANKNEHLKTCQNDIVEKLLPYEAKNNDPDLNINEDDFYAEYSLSEVYIVTGELGHEIQMSFITESGEDIISVHRDLESNTVIEFFDGYKEIYPEDMGL